MDQDLLTAARDAAVAGAAVLRRHFRRADLEIRSKGADGLVSEADHRSEEAIVGLLRRRFPDHPILSEEAGQLAGGHDRVEWLIDPLDGTTNFVQGLPLYCVAVACRVDGRLAVGVVHEPEGDNLFAAARGDGAWWNDRRMHISARRDLAGSFLATGFPWRMREALEVYLDLYREVFHRARATRRIGAAALDLAYTAAGVYDGFFELGLRPWDVAAGALLVEEAGGVVTDLEGQERYLESGDVLAAGPELHRCLSELFLRHGVVERARQLRRPAEVGR